MPLRPLPPAVAADIADDKPVFAWDEWNVSEYYAFVEDDLDDRLATISGRGAIALTLSVGEWICQRFSMLDGDREPLQFLEAAWADQMQPGLGAYTETDDEQWHGVVRGPLSMVITLANDALFCLEEDDNTGNRAAWMINLARHVLPKRDAFERWLQQVLDRLALHHPRQGSEQESLPDDDFQLGRPVPRQLFDTTQPFVPGQESALIAEFLKTVDPQNPFLDANASESADD
jgi:hypothetical protein